MKRLLAVAVLLSLNGCALWEAYNLAHFDPNEYRIVTEIRTDASLYKDQCPDAAVSRANAQAIYLKTQLFENYSEQIPYNSNSIKASKELNNIAKGLKERYAGKDPVSPMFCKLKFESIEHSAQTMQHVLGNRPR
ncbi:hypothetical protein UFOVP190_397 [uncultured Caudovirales phage]|uniref:Uncharacterized protein n=1 Tax=uncultured Caudovirales phage TaxID=2100421 RepID=A0A6J7WI42_9CAUD|nr:hypothetical protein UFOVP190_397 [uncultured Caudovirales phage]